MAHYKSESQIEQLGTSINKQLHEKVKEYCSKTGMKKNMVINDALIEYFAIQEYQQDLKKYCIKKNISVNEAIDLALKKLLSLRD